MYSSAEGLRLFFWGGGGFHQMCLCVRTTVTKIPLDTDRIREYLYILFFAGGRRCLTRQNVQRALLVAPWMDTRRSRDFLRVELNGGSLFLVDKQWQLQGSHLDPPHRLWRCPGKQHQNGFRQYTHRAVDFWWVKEIVTCVTVVLIAPQFPRCPVLTQLLSSSPPSTIPELYFLIARFLEAGPCQKAAEVGVFAFRDYLEHIRIRHER